MPHTLKKIISGGQTGVDQAALRAAHALGYATGGWMPKGFRTEAGTRPDLAKLYGMHETKSPYYNERTTMNVVASDGTLIFGNPNSAGCRLTLRLCNEKRKSLIVVRWPPSNMIDKDEFLRWLKREHIVTLNVAGNREERNPGIHDACAKFLTDALR